MESLFDFFRVSWYTLSSKSSFSKFSELSSSFSYCLFTSFSY
jgi:hypothetical protein